MEFGKESQLQNVDRLTRSLVSELQGPVSSAAGDLAQRAERKPTVCCSSTGAFSWCCTPSRVLSLNPTRHETSSLYEGQLI